MKPLKNCPDCERPLEPATLNPEHRWCSVCAVEYDKENKPVVRPGTEKKPLPTTFPGAVKVGVQPTPEATAAAGHDSPQAESAALMDEAHKNSLHDILQRGSPLACFRVTIGSVSFLAGRATELDVAGTKVRIEAL